MDMNLSTERKLLSLTNRLLSQVTSQEYGRDNVSEVQFQLLVAKVDTFAQEIVFLIFSMGK